MPNTQFLEINGQFFSPEELKVYIEKIKLENEYLDAKVRYLSECAIPNSRNAHAYVYIRNDPVFPDKKILSISFVYESGPKRGMMLGGLKDVTVRYENETMTKI